MAGTWGEPRGRGLQAWAPIISKEACVGSSEAVVGAGVLCPRSPSPYISPSPFAPCPKPCILLPSRHHLTLLSGTPSLPYYQMSYRQAELSRALQPTFTGCHHPRTTCALCLSASLLWLTVSPVPCVLPAQSSSVVKPLRVGHSQTTPAPTPTIPPARLWQALTPRNQGHESEICLQEAGKFY